MNTKKYYLDGLRKLRETLDRLLKKEEKKLQPQYVTLPRKNSHVVKKTAQN